MVNQITMKRYTQILIVVLITFISSCGGGGESGTIYFDVEKTKKWKETVSNADGTTTTTRRYKSY